MTTPAYLKARRAAVALDHEAGKALLAKGVREFDAKHIELIAQRVAEEEVAREAKRQERLAKKQRTQDG